MDMNMDMKTAPASGPSPTTAGPPPKTTTRPTKKRGPWSWIFEFAGDRKSKYVLSVILAFLGVLCAIAPYFIISDMIIKLLDGTAKLEGLMLSCGIMAVLWIGKAVFHALSTSASHIATFNVLGNIRKRVLAKLSRISLGDVQKQSSGALKNILVERVDSIETTMAHVIPEFTSNLVGALLTITFLAVVDWRMALACLGTFFLGLLFFMTMMIGYKENYGRTVRAVKGLNDAAVEYIGGIEVVKVFGKTKASYEKFVAAAKEGANAFIDWMKKSNVSFTIASVVAPATFVLVLPVGGLLFMNGSLSAQNFILSVILSMGVVTPVMNCVAYGDDLAQLGTIIGEVTSIIEEKDLVRPEVDKAEPADHSVAFRGVRFSYKGGSDQASGDHVSSDQTNADPASATAPGTGAAASSSTEVLHGIDLDFKEGEMTALVGPSGSGKSTIAKLLASYWDVNAGSISIGGVDIRDLSLEEYNKRIAYVSQSSYLFNDTVRENIRMGRHGASDEEVEQAARACGCHDFIMGLENGYDTLVGSSGGHLSGGERQRISIARAMLKNAPIVILDEATAYTDPENEAIIQDSIGRLVKGKTLIVIAHRLSTIVNAEKIYVIADGRVAESGTHESLCEKKGLYARMWEAHMAARDTEAEPAAQPSDPVPAADQADSVRQVARPAAPSPDPAADLATNNKGGHHA